MAQLPLTQARDLLHEKQPGEVCHPQVEGDQHSSICSPFIFFTNWHDLSERGKSTMALETMKNNRYRMVRPLGSGSTGEVYLVEDTLRNRQEVVLKLLHAYAHPLTHDAQSASQAFRFEAGAISQLTHPNILPLLDYGAETVDGEVVPFLVTPYCPDGSLATWL